MLQRTGLGCLLLGFIGGAAAAQAPPTFPGELIPTGSLPSALVLADFNGDGATDVAAANSGGNTITVAIANGGGHFTITSYVVGTTNPSKPQFLAAGDLDGDGLLDIVSSNSASNTLTIWMGMAGGMFGNVHHVYLNGLNSSPAGIALGDLDGDGKLDGVVANYKLGSISTLIGNGAGGLTLQLTVAATLHPKFLRLADFDGDGDLDLAVGADQAASIALMKWGGHPASFQPPVPIALTPGAYLLGMTAVDWNADGKVDLAAGGLGSLDVIPNNAPAGFGAPVNILPNSKVTSVGAGDLNADGIPDLVCTSLGGTSVFLGIGGGAFAPHSNYSGTLGGSDYGIADLTGDGIADLVTAGMGCNGIGLFRGIGGGAIAAPSAIPVGGGAISVVDLQGDGKADVIVANVGLPYSSIATYVGDGHGGLTFSQSVAIGGSGPLAALTPLDVDADGFVDFATADATSSGPSGFEVSVFRQTPASGAFASLGTYPMIGSLTSIAAGDTNNDGFPDLAVTRQNPDEVVLLTNNGAGVFAPAPPMPSGSGSPRCVRFADLDLDGNLDLLVSHYATGLLVVRLGNGLGSFGAPQSFYVGVYPMSFRVDDVDGDGRLDVATSCYSFVTFLVGATPGLFAPPLVVLGTPGPCYDTATADFNGDGKKDLAVAEFGVPSLLLYLGKGGMSFGAPTPLNAVATAVAAGDFHGEGKIDLVAGSQGGVVLYPNQTVTPGLTNYGTGTPGCAGAQTLFGSSAPKVGNAGFAASSKYGAPSALELLLIADAANAAGFDPLGLGILFHVDPFAATFWMGVDIQSDAVGAASAALPIPNQPQLQGAVYFAQVISAWPAPNCGLLPYGLSSSRGLRITIQ
jgi:hypothetical protein